MFQSIHLFMDPPAQKLTPSHNFSTAWGEMAIHSARHVSTISSLCQLYTEVSDALRRIHAQRSAYRHSRYGWIGKIYSWLGLFDTDTLRKSHWNVNCWTDEEAFAWKEACISSHNFVMVAASIFASLGLFSQTQTSMEDTHWSARALLTASMVCGIVSVVAATMNQDSLRRLHSHMDIRLWLSNGTSTSRDHYDRPYNTLPLKSSVTAHQLVEAPTRFLMLAVALYVVGYGLYLLFGWLYAVAQPTSDFRNIFIVYIEVVCISIGYFLSLGIWQLLEGQRLQERLKTDRFAPRIHASKEYQNLERIIALIVEFRKKNEEKLQIGTESVDDSSLVLKLLLQLWDETELCGRHGSRSSTSCQGAGGFKHKEPVEPSTSNLRGEAHESYGQGHTSDLRPVPQHVLTNSEITRQEPFDQSALTSGKVRPASR